MDVEDDDIENDIPSRYAEEVPVYNPHRRFGMKDLRKPEFKLAERVVMAGVRYP